MCLENLITLNDLMFCQTNYLNIYQTDICPIFRVELTNAVDDHAEIGCLVPAGRGLVAYWSRRGLVV